MSDREIEGVGDPLLAVGKPSSWEQYRLPVELSGRSFLDVGCWEGVHCAEAVRRGASRVIGVDLCTCPELAANVDRYGFEFLQMDVFSEKWVELGASDVVLCSGMLHHVENVVSLLFRLRRVVRELLVLETRIARVEEERPVMLFQDADSAPNPSNWWAPNRLCLERMLAKAGFSGISVVAEAERDAPFARLCLHAVPAELEDHAHLLPRHERKMSLSGGSRPHDHGAPD